MEKTVDEIKAAIKHCSGIVNGRFMLCYGCPYDNVSVNRRSCFVVLMRDALTLIAELENKLQTADSGAK